MILELDSERAGLTSAWLRKSERCGSSASWTPADTHVSTNVDRDRHHALLTQFSILGQHEVPSRSASGSKSEGEAGRIPGPHDLDELQGGLAGAACHGEERVAGRVGRGARAVAREAAATREAGD
eukprot:2677334-Rhodomonas_salina.3